MTRNEKIALAIGGGVVVFGGLALYFSATSKPPPSASPTATPPLTPQQPTQQFAPTTSPMPHPVSPTTSPSSSFPPSWNQFTNIVAGHSYLITLTSPTPFDWSRINLKAVPGGFNGPFGHTTPTPTQYTYSLTATVSHEVQNVGFLLGLNAYINVSVTDLGVL